MSHNHQYKLSYKDIKNGEVVLWTYHCKEEGCEVPFLERNEQLELDSHAVSGEWTRRNDMAKYNVTSGKYSSKERLN